MPRRVRPRAQKNSSADVPSCVDKRFDPSTFAGLSDVADAFFGSDLPFWDEAIASGALLVLPCARSQSLHAPSLTPKLGFWARIVTTFKVKQHDLKDSTTEHSHSKCEQYYDCATPSSMEKASVLHKPISRDSAYESVEF